MTAEFVDSAMMIGFFLIVGAAIGMISGMMGVGGGAALAPVLYFAFDALGVGAASVISAVGTACAVIAIISLVGLRYRVALNTFDPALMKRDGPVLAIGGAGGAVLALLMSAGLLTGALGAALFAAAMLILFAEGKGGGASVFARQPILRSAGFFGVGALSGLVGLGGAAFAGPLYRADGLTTVRSNSAAAAAALAISAPAALVFAASGVVTPAEGPAFSLGAVNLAATAVIAPMILACAPLGAQIWISLPSRPLRILFAFVMAMLALTIARRAGLA